MEILRTPEMLNLRKRMGRPTHRWEDNIVVCRAVSRPRLDIHIPVATDTHATIEVLLETVFSSRFVHRGYKVVKHTTIQVSEGSDNERYPVWRRGQIPPP
jgi:hypothetical protein